MILRYDYIDEVTHTKTLELRKARDLSRFVVESVFRTYFEDLYR